MMLKKRLSYSFAKDLLETPFEKIKYKLQNPKPPSAAMNEGNLFEYCLVMGNADDVIETKYKSDCKSHEDLKDEIIEASKNPELYKEHRYLIAPAGTKEKIETMLKGLSFQVKQIIKKAKKQVHVEMNLYNVPTHGYLDLETDDCIYDIKRTDPEHDKFSKAIINNKWHIQYFIYNSYGETVNKEYKWIVIDPEPPYINRIYSVCDNRYLERGEADFSKAAGLFEEFNEDKPVSIEQVVDAPYFV